MFTGLIREIGEIISVRSEGDSRLISYRAPLVSGGAKIGDSIAVNGVCQTVTALTGGGFSARAVAETLKKTTLAKATRGTKVNLEPALAMGDTLDGHIVQGHVSGTARIKSLQKKGENRFLTLELSPGLMSGCIPEGSVAVDGISLTIARMGRSEIMVNLIPLTWEETALKYKRIGDPVNIETDPLTRKGSGAGSESTLTIERLTQWGY